MATNFRVTSCIVHVRDIFGKSAILRGVRCPRLLFGAVCGSRCPGHWRILVSDFISPSLLTMGVRGLRWNPFRVLARGVAVPGPAWTTQTFPTKCRLRPSAPLMARRCALSTRMVEFLSAAPKCMPNVGRVGSCKSKSWSRSNRRASHV